MTEVITGLLALCAGIFTLIAAIGVLRFPDVLTRMHAASKTGAFAGGCALLAAAVVKCETARSQTEHAALTFYRSKRMFQTDGLMFCQAE